MSTERFEWDTHKAESNEKKHKVTFIEATSVFHNDCAIYFDDPRHSLDEERFVIIGKSIQENILMICHCMRESDTVVRIIARKATKQEKDLCFNQ